VRSPVRAALPRRKSLRWYVKIDKFDLSSEVLVIAEIGNNHEGDFGLAREMVHAAAAAGAQAVKFQTIVPGKLVSALHPARLEQLGRFAFPREQFAQLAEIARDAGLLFLSTPFDVGVVSWLNELVPAFKIASGDNDYEPLLEAVAATGKPVILSTGMSGIGQIAHSCAVIESVWQRAECVADIALLHCVSSYPTPPDEANLLAIATLSRELGKVVGYSDHTLGIDAAVLSVVLGARIIEKHFTLSKTQSAFRDHALSADPAEFAELVRKVKAAQAMLGDGKKVVQEVEKVTAAAARRSIVARVILPMGHALTLHDLDWLRPGGGLPPGQERVLLDHKLLRPVAQGEMITSDMVD
jgi:N,N'-diacetyllegionaminate synthase